MFELVVTGFSTKVDTTTHLYGNGVYCNDDKLWGNWNEANQIAGIVIGGGVSGLAGVGV
ncbi:bacteriocin [Enterococcus faecium]|nr:bacteriocin [Enterococcus faecium]